MTCESGGTSPEDPCGRQRAPSPVDRPAMPDAKDQDDELVVQNVNNQPVVPYPVLPKRPQWTGERLS